ncbi:MAG: transglycosylase SLT domain-containing protein [Nitrospirae bacterium]|nr:transglycosylase SLT domain-containing protein [Nitrospirota bacterium]
MNQRIARNLLCATVMGLCGSVLFPGPVSADPALPSLPNGPDVCESVEACFQAAALPKERLGKGLNKEQVLALKLARLQRVREQFPATVWAARAGLLSGVLLLERDPAMAMQFLRAAQTELPIVDDYVRLWTGEALLSLGEARQAAEMFESIPQTATDSSLSVKAAYRAGEAWYQALSCREATAWIAKAVGLSQKEVETPRALLRQGACQLRENNILEGRETLKQLWVRFASSAEAKEAEALLASNLGGEPWVVQPSERLARAQVYLGQAFHAEAIEELRKFLVFDPSPSQRAEAKLKLGIAQEGQGDKLLELARAVATSALSSEQKGQISLFAGVWLEDQGRFDEAIGRYRQVAKGGEPASQRAEGQWRVGWGYYRMGRYREASEQLRLLADQRDGDFEPQALYWLGRAIELNQQPQARDVFVQLCQRYVYTYYCQLARERADIPLPGSPAVEPASMTVSVNGGSPANGEASRAVSARAEIEQQPAYRRAMELKTLGLDSDVARELAGLTDRYSRDPDLLLVLSTMLNEAGAYHPALRLARAKFRDQLERTGGAVAPVLWTVAYPTGLLPTIRGQGAKGVDPYLVAAIIREESQYDWRAVSQVGAIGLMQVMPGTANNVAQRLGLPAVGREDLFDQETNIRIGVRYVEQLLEQFSGNVAYTIASYNAGPLAVGNWIAQHRGRSQDEFVELIPYRETRQYVKRVLRSYREYARLGQTP